MFIISSFKLTRLKLRYNRELCVNSRKSWFNKGVKPTIPASHHYTIRIERDNTLLRKDEDSISKPANLHKCLDAFLKINVDNINNISVRVSVPDNKDISDVSHTSKFRKKFEIIYH